MTTIYQTFYDPQHPAKLPTGPSEDCGLETLAEVEEMMGEPEQRDPGGRYLIYPNGLCFSTIKFA